MHEHLLERVRLLELANRRWKTTAFGLAIALVLLLVVVALAVILGLRIVTAETGALRSALEDANNHRVKAEQLIRTLQEKQDR